MSSYREQGQAVSTILDCSQSPAFIRKDRGNTLGCIVSGSNLGHNSLFIGGATETLAAKQQKSSA
jgi:hypothetical protein